MAKILEFKANDTNIVELDAKKGYYEVVIAHLNNIDSGNDVILSDAFTKTIRESGPKGSNMIWHLFGHDEEKPLTKPDEIYIIGNEVRAKGIIVPTSEFGGADTIMLYEAKKINQHSIGYRVINYDYDQATDIRTIKELQLFEYSSVLWGMNTLTPTIAVGNGKKSFGDITINEIDNKIEELSLKIANSNYKEDLYQFKVAKLSYYIDLKRQFLHNEAEIKRIRTEPANKPKTSFLNYL